MRSLILATLLALWAQQANAYDTPPDTPLEKQNADGSTTLMIITPNTPTSSKTKKKKHGLGYKLTHLGLVHGAATVCGSPFWVAGFTTTMVGGFVGIPFVRGMQYFESRPFVSW